MIPWVVDADNYAIIDKKDLVITPDIENFLDIERDYISFVAAPKGVGKTLFLKLKKNLYMKKHEKDIYFIPKDQSLARCDDLPLLDKEKIASLEKSEIWLHIWRMALSLSIIKTLLADYDPEFKLELKKIFEEFLKSERIPSQVRANLGDYFVTSLSGNLSEVLKFGEGDLTKLYLYQTLLTEALRQVRAATAIFIDNIDESFNNFLWENYSKHIWYNSQISLLKAVHSLSRINSHIKIFTTIRTEAYQKMIETDSLGHQLRGQTLDIIYSKPQLREMFIKNILAMRERDLKYPGTQRSDPLYSFLGLKNNEVINGKVKSKPEDIFNYIYRHTLKRPRDLMTIGGALQGVSIAERDEDNIRRIVNKSGEFIAVTYFNEMKYFTGFNQIENVFDLIHSNILSQQDIRQVCCKYNRSKTCEGINCKKCNKTHIFCGLYKLGLLGIVVESATSEKMEQKFLRIGEAIWNSNILVPSEYYLLHPILNSRLREKNLTKGYENPINEYVIVGDSYPWEDPHITDEHK